MTRLAALLLILSAPLVAEERRHAVLDILSVYDGDTATLRLDAGLDLSRTVTVRLRGIDTPEIRPLATRAAATRARDYLRERLASCDALDALVEYEDGRAETGKFGRLLVRLQCDGEDLAAEMIRRGLGEEY